MIIKSSKPRFTEGSHMSIEFLNIKHQTAHNHPDAIEIIYCLSGTLNVKIAHETLSVAPGELLTLDHKDIHALWSDDDNTILLIHLDASGLSTNWEKESYFLFSCESHRYQHHQHQAFMKICNLVLCAGFMYLEESQDISLYDKIAYEIYNTLCSDFQWFSMIDAALLKNEKYWDRLHNLLEYITDHYNEKIMLSTLADKVYIDKIYLSQFFKKTSFTSFLVMINYLRCYNAESLLLFSDKTIHDISYECGFSSTKYFHKYFKGFWLISPLQHRKWYQRYAKIPESVSRCTKDSIIQPLVRNIVTKQLDML